MNFRKWPVPVQMIVTFAVMMATFTAISILVPGWEDLWKFGIFVSIAYAIIDQLWIKRRYSSQ